jgi:hypothetical protein
MVFVVVVMVLVSLAEIGNLPLRETRSRFLAEGGRSPENRGRTLKDGGAEGHPVCKERQRMKIGEEAAPTLGLILERLGDLPPIKEPSAPQASASGRRPTHKRAEVGASVRMDRSEAEPESTRSPTGAVAERSS